MYPESTSRILAPTPFIASLKLSITFVSCGRASVVFSRVLSRRYGLIMALARRTNSAVAISRIVCRHKRRSLDLVKIKDEPNGVALTHASLSLYPIESSDAFHGTAEKSSVAAYDCAVNSPSNS